MKINSSLTPSAAFGCFAFGCFGWQEIEQALGKRVEPRKRGWRKATGGIEGEQIELDFNQR